MDVKAMSMIHCILLLLLLVTTEASHVTLTLPTANRSCERKVQEVRLQQQNVTFPCWKQEVVPMHECDKALAAIRPPPALPPTARPSAPPSLHDTPFHDAASLQAHQHAPGSDFEDNKEPLAEAERGGGPIDEVGAHFLPLAPAHKHKREAGVCFRNSLQKCHMSVMIYQPVTVAEKVCCPGYEHTTDNDTCQAVSTCMTNNGGCDQVCRQSDGKAVCSCYHGYELQPDQRRCKDVNECDVKHGGCSHRCHNIPGSFYCSCPGGYGFNSPASRNCTDVNECQFFNGGCEHKCVNTRGAFYCECFPGYRRRDGFRCISCDDDFSLAAGAVHSCAHTASEEEGSVAVDMGYMAVPFMVVLLLIVVGAHLALSSAHKRAAARRANVLRCLQEQFKNVTYADAIELPALGGFNTPPPPYQPPTPGRVFTVCSGTVPARTPGRAIRASSSSSTV